MDAANEARRLEQELEDDPEDRDDVLLAAADAWRRAGNPGRAILLLDEAIGGENTDRARVAMAEILFRLGREDEARAQLDALRKSWPESSEVLHDVAFLLEKRGELEEALVWYDLAIARVDPDDRADDVAAADRRGVRQKLGLPEDELDVEVEPLARRLEEALQRGLAEINARRHPPR
ncbi:tetratricopeptide repeat protein [Lentzea aerocolonigenes]|uniref:tetratricopeptide repeat protein n=1 Tax=Lentzea aerocolonigenes TaxID=68170 RepID=UPI0004C3F971|nr:tetratricopeptide repeat protein [Lentzea aerocolonigenes]MCP2248285.1 Tetratricopeptide repeat-containing protein [Lentzea aerocolonigenes]